MDPLALMALIILVLSLVKVIVIFIDPKIWFRAVVKKVYGHPRVTQVLAVIGLLLVLKYLLVEITIVQIFAVMLFFMFLMAIGFASYNKEIIKFAHDTLSGKHVLRKSWLSLLIWFSLLVWLLFTLLVK